MRHDLKTEQRFFKQAWAHKKPFEIRKNDRNYEVADEVNLIERDQYGEPTGRRIEGFILYVTDYQQREGYVVFSYEETRRLEE